MYPDLLSSPSHLVSLVQVRCLLFAFSLLQDSKIFVFALLSLASFVQTQSFVILRGQSKQLG